MCAHLCYKTVYCAIYFWCIVVFLVEPEILKTKILYDFVHMCDYFFPHLQVRKDWNE